MSLNKLFDKIILTKNDLTGFFECFASEQTQFADEMQLEVEKKVELSTPSKVKNELSHVSFFVKLFNYLIFLAEDPPLYRCKEHLRIENFICDLLVGSKLAGKIYIGKANK